MPVGFETALLFENQFLYLCTLPGGNEKVYHGITIVESDFSVIERDQNEFCGALTDFSLEDIMNSQELKTIQMLPS